MDAEEPAFLSVQEVEVYIHVTEKTVLNSEVFQK